MKVVMIPSVSGGIGHVSRTAALARALRSLDPSVQVEFVLDTRRLRPFNIKATMQLGFRPRLLPELTRQNRDAVAAACFGDADVIVDDATRYLVPWRRAVPRAAWVSILMHPVGDELYVDWPWMAQTDALIWPYAPLVGLPAELAMFEGRILRTGPFLETEAVPDKPTARQLLGLRPEEQVVVYAVRGFPFGRTFGHGVLGSLYQAVEALRAATHPRLRLVLLAVGKPEQLQDVPGLPRSLPGWVRVEGVVPSAEALLYARAADILVGEGTSTMHEGAALRTPMVLFPGPIQEASVLGRRLGEHGVAEVFGVGKVAAEGFEGAFEPVTPEKLAAAFAAILAGGEARRAKTQRAYELVNQGGGAIAAARLVLDVAARRGQAEAAQ